MLYFRLLRHQWDFPRQLLFRLDSTLMAIRVFLTLVMLTQVLACPFLRCEGCQGVAHIAPTVASTCCADRCKHRGPQEQLPASDEQSPIECEWCNCFCRGVVQPNRVKCPNMVSVALFDATLDVGLLSGTICQTALPADASSVRSSPHFPPLLAGSSLRALTQTFLL
jgi:hypothetical protein